MKNTTPQMQTVRGPVDAGAFGFALPHEHVLCDFIGAKDTGRHRWDPDEVVRVMLPYLQRLKRRGVSGFVDCTPAFIGRDPRVLRRLAEATGLHVLTNTGYYGAAGDKFLPPHAFTESSDKLAHRWIGEWEKGIDGTGVKPGFVKIGVDPVAGNTGRLSDVDAKLARAAARTSKRTGLVVASHTVQGAAAWEQLDLFEAEGVAPDRFVFVHADGETDASWHRRVAARGAWVEFDAVGSRPVEQHVALVKGMIDAGHAGRLLLSMDRGWYNAGEPNGGTVRDYNVFTDAFLPALRKSGVPDATVRTLTVENPARAFSLRT
jgi:phosphotriesterase-related protein